MAKVQKLMQKSKRMRVQEGDRIFVGVDVHKKTYHVAVWAEQADRLLVSWVQPAVPEVLMQILVDHLDALERIVYEAGPTGFTLARHLEGNAFPVEVISAAHTPKAPASRAKSDRIDCRDLARLASKGLLHKIYIPTVQEEGDRQVERLRDQMMKNQRRAKQQIKSFLLQHGVGEPHGLKHWTKASVAALWKLDLMPQLRFSLTVLLEELVHAQSQVRRATQELAEVGQTDRHKKEVELLQSAPGVGPITAMTFRTEVPNPQRFKDRREVGKFLGLSAQVRSTGETRHECGREQGGNRRVRTMLIEAAWRWIAQDRAAQERYRQLLANTGNSKKAIVAMARKLGIILWCMTTRGERYRSQPCAAGGQEAA